MDWYCGNFDASVAPSVKACDWLILPSELSENTTDPTLMALRVHYASISASTPTTGDVYAAGIIVWNFVDDTMPTPDQCPGPLTNCDFDWAWYWVFPAVPLPAGQQALQVNTGCDTGVVSKARRRLGNDRSLLVVFESIGDTSFHHLHARALIKE